MLHRDRTKTATVLERHFRWWLTHLSFKQKTLKYTLLLLVSDWQNSSSFQAIVWYRIGDKPSLEPNMTQFTAEYYICDTRFQWVTEVNVSSNSNTPLNWRDVISTFAVRKHSPQMFVYWCLTMLTIAVSKVFNVNLSEISISQAEKCDSWI